jgi:hypothetical protein
MTEHAQMIGKPLAEIAETLGIPWPSKGFDEADDELPEISQPGEIAAGGDAMIEHGDAMLQFFAWEHLPLHLQEVSKHFMGIANMMVGSLPRNPERSAGLRKLLEAKDCAVRARLYK